MLLNPSYESVRSSETLMQALKTALADVLFGKSPLVFTTSPSTSLAVIWLDSPIVWSSSGPKASQTNYLSFGALFHTTLAADPPSMTSSSALTPCSSSLHPGMGVVAADAFRGWGILHNEGLIRAVPFPIVVVFISTFFALFVIVPHQILVVPVVVCFHNGRG